MARLTDFQAAAKWPPAYPDRVQLYYLPTPNGLKVAICLEEMDLPWEAHRVEFSKQEQFSPEFLDISPNNKIPAMIDPDGPDGEAIALFESGAILFYLAEKSGQFMPTDPTGRYQCMQWLMFQMGGIGPMFGQFGHFHKFARDKVVDPYPLNRYLDETRRLLGVLEKRLTDRDYLLDWGYSIADMAVFPWLNTLIGFYEAGDLVGMSDHPSVDAYWQRCLQRPAVQRVLA